MGSSYETLARAVADVFVNAFDRIEGNWQEPWIRSVAPQQNLSGNVYSGSNRLLLGLLASFHSYDLPVWMTINQANSIGVSVIKGEKSSPVIMYDCHVRDVLTGKRVDMTEEEYKNLDIDGRSRYKLEVYTMSKRVFNVSQTNFSAVYPEVFASMRETLGGSVKKVSEAPLLDVMIEKGTWVCPVECGGTSLPVYDQNMDVIRMPDKGAYADESRWYCDLLKQMARSTGSELRLDRDLWSDSLDSAALEQMVSELAAATVAAAIGADSYMDDNSLRYLKTWSQVISDDPSVIYKAVREGAKAASFIMNETGISGGRGVDLMPAIEKMAKEQGRSVRQTEPKKVSVSRRKRK